MRIPDVMQSSSLCVGLCLGGNVFSPPCPTLPAFMWAKPLVIFQASSEESRMIIGWIGDTILEGGNVVILLFGKGYFAEHLA
jgi:hypothetical protein